MNNYGMNGMTTELDRAETPFADIALSRETQEETTDQEGSFSNYLSDNESPFSGTYEITGASSVTPAGEEFVQFVGELNDSEFGNAIYELAAELEDSWSNKISSEVAMGSNYIPFVTRSARDYMAPLARETENMVDRVAEYFSTNNFADRSESEVDSFFETLSFDHSGFTPAQEQFFGGVFNKIKNVVKKGVDLAKKGISIVGKFLPMNIILGKIKGLIRPLLDKVLKFAIGKLPVKLQPYAQTLASKFLNLETNNEEETSVTVNNTELDSIQTELDNHIAQLVFSPTDVQAEDLIMSYETSYEDMEQASNYETGSAANQLTLNEARQQFIDDLKNLREGESPAPAIERFLPIPIMGLQPIIKMAISIIGRPKIIDFLANLLAKLVGKYVPADVAKPLSASIVDLGLHAIGFETNEAQQEDLAYEAIANTIQETIQNMNELTEETLNNNEELTAQLLEAFETAAANNFPPQYIRENLRPTKHKATWVMMPRKGPAHYYKKFTHVFDICIEPQTASTVQTFRGLPLANFLRDKYGINSSKPIKARVHIYEATKDTRLHRISKYENLPGLNARQPKAWVQLLPLTKQAATLLLKEPALGKNTSPQNLSSRYRTVPGQRFYFLEINGARLRVLPVKVSDHRHKSVVVPTTAAESHSGDIQAVINFIRSEIILNYYFSEEDAKAVAEKLNANDYLGVAQSIRVAIKKVLNDMLLKNISSKVKIIHEAIPELYLEQYNDREEQFAPLEALKKLAGKGVINKLVGMLTEKISGKAYESVTAFLKARAGEFKEAQAQQQDGVTVKLSWKNVAGMPAIRTAINALQGNLSIPSLGDLEMPRFTTPEIKVVAGKKFD